MTAKSVQEGNNLNGKHYKHVGQCRIRWLELSVAAAMSVAAAVTKCVAIDQESFVGIGTFRGPL